MSLLTTVIQAFKNATTYFSRENATLATVIPAMDQLDTVLATAVISKADGSKLTIGAPVKAALLVAKDTLNRYYKLSDESELYRLAISAYSFSFYHFLLIRYIVLHPQYKLQYFQDQDWPQEWQDKAKKLLTDTFADYADVYDSQLVEIVEPETYSLVCIVPLLRDTL